MDSLRPPEELYILETDPYEIFNLANNSKYSFELKNLRDELDSWLQKNDFGTYPEDQNEIIYAEKEASKRHSQILKNRELPKNAIDEDLIKNRKTI